MTGNFKRDWLSLGHAKQGQQMAAYLNAQPLSGFDLK